MVQRLSSADRIVCVGRSPISCSILYHSAAANRVTVEGTVTQLRQRARGSWSGGIKAENHPSAVSFASPTGRSGDLPIKQATMAFKVLRTVRNNRNLFEERL